ncbi:hypothetical protein MWU52_00370 [Jannaschia sp. S6380]|uniref:hypothetical protein n=1 Tax=Jannaschia sp. S6380 TaxID=2926408 RepID=UPI001FF67DB9|nr:hypothetical protein [Jannaschia sp. S6380]MCK0165995.1 hypothetical protein [Jannaschia sp. S6380]
MAHHSITPVDLAARLHRIDAPRILDMRDDDDAASDPRRMPGACPIQLAELERMPIPAGPVICTCQKGGKLSQLGAAILRARGEVGRYLAGGHLAWVAGDLPLCDAGRPAARWVVPCDPGWDELCALWVLRRLVDRDAPAMPVERDWRDAAAETWDARPLPATPAEMATLAGLDHPILPRLAGGPARLVAGRLARGGDPVDALDLVDDWVAAPAIAA